MELAHRFTRREAVKLGVLGSAALLLPFERTALTTSGPSGNRMPTSALPKPFSVPFQVPPVLQPVKRDATTDWYRLRQQQVSVEILPGKRTTVFAYNGVTPGPTIVAQRGRPVVVQHCNDLPQTHPTLGYRPWTSTHLHGSASLPEYDGYASDVTQPGDWKWYRYPNFQDARTLWYHDHGVHHTAENAYMGLAAMYVLHDDVEQGLGLPGGRYDVPLILRDALFATDGSLIYDDHSHSGTFGDVILVNGRPWPAMPVERRLYRFRVLNASISRSYRLQLSTGEPLTVIGTDGGLMPIPRPVRDLRIGMAERYEIVVDFSKYKVGQRIMLRNLGLPNNIDEANTDKLMAFDVVSDATSTDGNALPSVLNPNLAVMGLTTGQSRRSRSFLFKHFDSAGGGEAWGINGTTWQDVIDSDYRFTLANPGYDDVEIWTLENKSGGWFHPVHIHLVDFKVLDRNGKPPFEYEKGPKDVVYIGEGERVRVIMRFTGQRGRYMMHCHNLVHEDHDMMGQFEVGTGGDDPILADPARHEPAEEIE